MKVYELIERLNLSDPQTAVVAEDGEFGAYDIEAVEELYINQKGWFVSPTAKTLVNKPKTYRLVVRLR